jgi:hypothetical protein
MRQINHLADHSLYRRLSYHIALFTAHLCGYRIEEQSRGLFVHVQMPFIHWHRGYDRSCLAPVCAASFNDFNVFPEMTMLHFFLELLV